MPGRESGECEDVFPGVAEHRGDLRMGFGEHPGDLVELGVHVCGVGLGESGADDRGDHFLGALGHGCQDVAHEVHPAALPRRALEHGADGLFQPAVRIRDSELHPVQPTGLQRPQERRPEPLVLTVTNIESEDFPAPVGGDAESNHDRLGHHPVPDPGLAIGRIQEHIRVFQGREVPVAERTDFMVEILTDPGYLGLRNPGIRAEGLDQVIDLAGGNTVQVGLHHHRVQGLVHPAAALQQGREKRAGTQLGDLQVQIPRSGRQRPGPGPVALGGARLGALERGSTNERGRLRLDELLIQGFSRGTNPIGNIGEFQLSKQIKQGRLV